MFAVTMVIPSQKHKEAPSLRLNAPEDNEEKSFSPSVVFTADFVKGS